MKIIVEGNIPFFRGIFDDVAQVEYLAPGDITAAAVADADAVVTRTRTRCDEALLGRSSVRLVASATIGLDHVDCEWCRQSGITVRNAPGCNAPAVAQYVFGSLLSLLPDLKGKTIGIVGAGHVGSVVEHWARALGMRVMLNDPPREKAEGSEGFSSLGDIALEADVITFHTPYTTGGEFPTHHLLDSSLVESLRRRPVIINSARGGVTDTGALLSGLRTGRIGHLVIDCWEGEPDIDRSLLKAADVATPHIAGYSRQGKARASRMAAEAVAEQLGLPLPQFAPLPYWPEAITPEAARASYDPSADTAALKGAPERFEQLRNSYHLREELGAESKRN